MADSRLKAPITCVQRTIDGNANLVSTLDSTIRLIDKGNGSLLQNYKGHSNIDYRIRSALGMADAVVVSGSEDGHLYAWNLLQGKAVERMQAHDGKVASAVAWNGTKKEWASAGSDGKTLPSLCLNLQSLVDAVQAQCISGVCLREVVLL